MSIAELKHDVPLEKNLDELYGLIEGIEIVMFTTRRKDGRLVPRPMATHKRKPRDRSLVRNGHRERIGHGAEIDTRQ